ncbi:hypothetical protein [Lichenihabitans psoromatis]|uniref:hypothetical protein n=1 Tax=Lichenihabitans psoromatis TaxID=2528642 RepID=UPI0010382FF1|nr:hypothetical protein [Lichenihabitans psoromatis]
MKTWLARLLRGPPPSRPTANREADPVTSPLAMPAARPDLLVIQALGQRHPSGRGGEVILVNLLARDAEWPIALDTIPLTDGGERVTDVLVGTHEQVGAGIKIGPNESLALTLREGGSIRLLTHPWSGAVRLIWQGREQEIDLYAAKTATIDIDLPGPANAATTTILRPDPKVAQAALEATLEGLGSALRLTLERLSAAGSAHSRVVAVSTPRWRGVTAATTALFQATFPMPYGIEGHPDDLTDQDIETYARVLAALPIDQIVISGGDRFFLKLIDAVEAINPRITFTLLWHSSYLQMGEPHDLALLTLWLDAARDRRIRRIGVVKRGMEAFFQRFGIEAVFVQNAVPFTTSDVVPTRNTQRVGLWLSGSSEYRKVPYNTLCAVSLIDGIELTGSGFDPRAMMLARELRLRAPEISPTPLPHAMMLRHMRRTALTLYVTVSECMPMVPLESIAAGVPCLIGPSCHLFADDPVLRELYVVERPGSPDHIAGRIRDALKAWPASFEPLMRYMADYNRTSVETVDRLIA